MKVVVLLVLLSALLCGVASAATVTLKWDYTQGSDPAVSFVVYRQPGCAGVTVVIGTVAYPTLTFADTSVVAGSIYFYKVTARNAAGAESDGSNVVAAQVPIPLASPTVLGGTITP